MKKETFKIDNLSGLAGDQQVADLKKRLKQATHASIYMILSFVVLIIGIAWILIINPAFSFAVLHNDPASKYAKHYYLVEKATKDSAKEVLDNWVATGEIK